MVAHKINLPPCSFNHLQWIVMAILLLQVVLAEAGEYTLHKMENVDFYPVEVKEVCAAYVKNLNKLGKPMLCEFKLPSSAINFRKIEWNKINPEDNIRLVREIVEFRAPLLGGGLDPKNVIQRRIELDWERQLELIKKKALLLSLAVFDIDNDGKKDHILRLHYRINGCDHPSDFLYPPLGQHYILKKEGKKWVINTETSRYIYLSSWMIFQYKGKIFFDLWRGRSNQKEAEIQVYYPKRVLNEETIGQTLVCRIKYNTK